MNRVLLIQTSKLIVTSRFMFGKEIGYLVKYTTESRGSDILLRGTNHLYTTVTRMNFDIQLKLFRRIISSFCLLN